MSHVTATLKSEFNLKMLLHPNTPDIDPSSRKISDKKPRRPHTKTRTGCRICRRRKVKCDETRPTCKNCQRRGLEDECDYAYGEAMQSMVPSATGLWIQPQGYCQPGGLAYEGILNIPLPAATVTDSLPPFATGALGGVSLPPITPGESITFDDTIPPNQHPPPIGAFTSSATRPPIISDLSRDVSSCSPHSPTRQDPSWPTQTPTYITSPLPLIPVSQHLDPNGLTAATLIHLFTTITAFSCSTQRAVQNLFSAHVPRQALRLAHTRPRDMDYLLYSVLAYAAIHASTLASQTRRKNRKDWWRAKADEYHALTLDRFQHAIDRYAAPADLLLQGEGGVRKSEEMLAKLTFEEVDKGHTYKVESSGSDSMAPSQDKEVADIIARCVRAGGKGEETKGQGGQEGGIGCHAPKMRVIQNKAEAAEVFSRLRKERIDEVESILLSASFLTLYAIASNNLDSQSSSPTDAITTSSVPAAHLPTVAGTSPTAAVILPQLTLPQWPMLAWVPLLRGTPTMIYHSPLGWFIFTQGNLSPLSAGLFKALAPDHPYKPRLTHLYHALFAQEFNPHPRLRPPLYPMTEEIFQKVMEKMIQCFARFFGGGDFLAAALSFPAAAPEGFWLSLGIAGGSNGVGELGAASAVGHDGRKDPRALVVMAYALVLVVLVVELFPVLFPEHSKETRVGEDVYGLLGIDLTDLGSGVGPSHEGRHEPDCEGEDGQDAPRKFKHCGYPPLNHPTNALSQTWWIAGLGEREIEGIAWYLGALDEEERQAGGMDARILGRWMKWMEWPLGVIKDRGRDMMGVLAEAAEKAASM